MASKDAIERGLAALAHCIQNQPSAQLQEGGMAAAGIIYQAALSDLDDQAFEQAIRVPPRRLCLLAHAWATAPGCTRSEGQGDKRCGGSMGRAAPDGIGPRQERPTGRTLEPIRRPGPKQAHGLWASSGRRLAGPVQLHNERSHGTQGSLPHSLREPRAMDGSGPRGACHRGGSGPGPQARRQGRQQWVMLQ